jgi:hypothetical protein
LREFTTLGQEHEAFPDPDLHYKGERANGASSYSLLMIGCGARTVTHRCLSHGISTTLNVPIISIPVTVSHQRF